MTIITEMMVGKKQNVLGGWCETCSAINCIERYPAQGTGPVFNIACIQERSHKWQPFSYHLYNRLMGRVQSLPIPYSHFIIISLQDMTTVWVIHSLLYPIMVIPLTSDPMVFLMMFQKHRHSNETLHPILDCMVFLPHQTSNIFMST